MLPDMADVLTEWEIPVKLKTVTRQTVDFVDADVVVVADIKAVVQVAQKERLNTDAIDWSLRYLQIHSKEQLTVGQFIEFEGEDYKIIDDGDYQLYGFSDVVAEQTKRPLIEPAPAPTCTITLTGDGLDALGLEPMSVTGQTVSATGDGSSNFAMWTGASGVPVNWAGVRVIEVGGLAMTGSAGQAILQFVRASDLDAVAVSWRQNDSDWLVNDSTGVISLPGTISDSFAIGIDGATGDVTVFQNGSPVVTSSTPADSGTFAGLAGMFSGDSAIITNLVTGLGNGDTYSAEIITQADKYTQTYPAGTLDWCGNEIKATP